MAIARFIPSMYEHFLKEKATFKLPDDMDSACKKDTELKIDDYPHFALFMTMHVGQAFENYEIEYNIETINQIPVADILEKDVTIQSLQSKYPSLIWPGSAYWD